MGFGARSASGASLAGAAGAATRFGEPGAGEGEGEEESEERGEDEADMTARDEMERMITG